MQDTYSRRARQLVKQERASWVSDDCILLADEPREEILMENIVGKLTKSFTKPKQNVSESTVESAPSVQQAAEQTGEQERKSAFVPSSATMSDEEIRRLAQDRLDKKHVLFWQGVDLALLGFVLLLLIGSYDSISRLAIAGIYGMFCLMRYLPKVIRFSQPISKGGYSKKQEGKRVRKLNAEYDRLKETLH